MLRLVGSKVIVVPQSILYNVIVESEKKRRDKDAVVKSLLFYLRSTTDSSSCSNNNDNNINSKEMDTSARTSMRKETLGFKFNSFFQRLPSSVVAEWGREMEQQSSLLPMSDLSNVVTIKQERFKDNN